MRTLARTLATLALGLLAATPAAAQTKKVDPNAVNQEVSNAAKNFDGEIDKAAASLKKLNSQIDKYKAEAKAAKAKADDAAKAADAARIAANACATEADKKKVEKQIEDAKKKRDAAKAASDKLDEMEKLPDKAVDGVSDRLKQLDDMADQGIQAATEQLGEKSYVINNLKNAKAAVAQAKDKYENGPQQKLNQAKRELKDKMEKAKGNNDPKGPLDEADRKLKEAEDALKKCPPPKEGAMLPGPPKEVYVAVDNRPHALACITDGQDLDTALAAMGVSESQVVARNATGTVVRTPMDPKTLDKAAQDNNVKTCFPAEGDFCTIMTPLTPFRGHDHAAHLRSGRGVHEHDGPDPPPDWGVEPPVPVIILERDR